MEDQRYTHYKHIPINVNALVSLERKTANFSDKTALFLTKSVGTMACAYAFAVLAIIGMPGLLPPAVAVWVQWVSQTFIQLVMLSILMVGQRLMSRHQELQSDEAHPLAKKLCADLETIIAQNNELIHDSKKIQKD
jgi:non-ribosomal peptide synthetase component E (peptide arylation enzyme)